jgi:4-amino-4-deoxy-L-arabinose transferase-like glycosyltransferase
MTRVISGIPPQRSATDPAPLQAAGASSPPRVATRRHWLEVLLLTLALAVWFGYELGSRELWSPDEGRYAEIPREMLATGDFLTPRLNGVKYFEKPPLVYWLEAGAIKIFGLNEWALRLWPALFALFGCLAVYFVANGLYGRPAGLLSAGVLATSPLYDFMGDILTLDMPLTGELAVALCAFLAGIRAPPGAARRLLFYTFYAFTAFAVLTKGLVGLAIPAMVIGVWIVVLNRWRVLREIHLPTGLILFLAIAVPWHVLVARANPEFAWFYFVHEHLERYLTTIHKRYEPAWFFVPVLLAGLYPWTVFLPAAVREAARGLWHRRAELGEVWFLLLWATLPFVFFSFSDSKLIPYVLPVWPPLALLLGRWLARVCREQAALGRAEFVVLLLSGALLGAGLALAPRLLPNRPHVASISTQLGIGLYTIAGGLALAGLLPLAVWWRRNPRSVIAALFLGAALLITAFDLNLSRLDVGRSVKDLALVLKSRLRPGDEVMTYETYYQDLPVYLERRVTVVNWKGELEFGSTVEDTRAWMIDTAAFRRRWNGPGRVYLLTSHSDYDKLLADPPGPMHLIAQTQHAVLVVNRGAPS